jgi:chaperone modulatory protein CbpM
MIYSETQVVAEIDGVDVRQLRVWVRKGWIVPAASDGEARFDDLDLARIRLVAQLQDELQIGEDALPLSLLDQLHGARRELRSLADAIERQPEDIRRQVLASFRGRREG